jgi:ABC-type transport system involved in cytochrome c biogenesis permease subunit
MNAYRKTALVLLTGFGLYFGLLVPALTLNWMMIPVGVILLVAAVVLLIDTRRERRDS